MEYRGYELKLKGHSTPMPIGHLPRSREERRLMLYLWRRGLFGDRLVRAFIGIREIVRGASDAQQEKAAHQ